MQIQQATYGSLHHRTKGKFPILPEDTRVFVARKGTKIIGTAYVRHDQFTMNGWEDRELQCNVTASDSLTQMALVDEAREATRRLKRRFTVLTQTN